MAEIKSYITKLELNDGETVELTMNFARLFVLKSQNKADVETALAMFSENVRNNFNVLDFATFMWVAYLCANTEPKYDRDEFMAALPFDLKLLSETFANIVSPKKK